MRLSLFSPLWSLSLVALVGACGDDVDGSGVAFDAGGVVSADTVGDARTGDFDAAVDASAPIMETVTLRFRAKVGDADFACGARYPGQGTGHSTITPRDFRFYVQQVALETAQGELLNPGLTVEDGSFQTRDVALIDFTDKTGECAGGPDENHDELELVVPAGKDFVGLRFTIGVDEALNHGDPTQAPAPLQAPGASWDWTAGYRFLIAEVLPGDLEMDGGAHRATHDGSVAGGMDAGTQGGQHGDGEHGGGEHGGGGGHVGGGEHGGGEHAGGEHGDGGGHGDGGAHGHGDGGTQGGHGGGPAGLGFIHLGSTGCTREGDAFRCDNPNRVQVTLRDFDPRTNVIIADLGALFRDADLRGNLQCHGSGDACAPMFEALGVDLATGQPLPTQRVFRVE